MITNTGLPFASVFEDLINRSNSVFQGLPWAQEEAAEIPDLLTQIRIADGDDAVRTACQALLKVLIAVGNASNEPGNDIDLSDGSRLVVYEQVRDRFIWTLMLSEDLSSKEIHNLIMEHVDFVQGFNELSETELNIRARRLSTLCNTLRG